MRLQGILVTGLLFVGCGMLIFQGLGARLPRADLRFGNASEPQTLDPATMTGVPEGRIARALYEGLTYPNLADLTHPKPGVAMRWTMSPDGRTYTFYLREDAKWSNGKAVTAAQFLFSWRRALTPATGSQYAELLWSVLHARAYNQQLISAPKRALSLQQSPSDKSPTTHPLKAGELVVKGKSQSSGQVKWRHVTSCKTNKSGWLKESELQALDYTFPPKPKSKGPKPWEAVGLKVKALQKPLPKGYSASALGKKLIFEVTLAHPTAYFTQLIAHYSMSPVYPPLVKKHPRRWVLPEHFVGNGPFRLTHWMINDLVRVEKNKHYWDAKHVGLKSIHFLALTERDTQLSMYLSKDLDIISNKIPLPTVHKLQGRKDFHNEPYFGTYFYRLNVKQPPLHKKKVRQALAWAVDRESIVKYVLRAGQQAATQYVPPGIKGYEPSTRKGLGPSFDPKRAKRLLAEAGYPNGKGFPALSLLYNTDQSHKQIAEAIQKMWHKHLGIKVNLVNKEWKTYLDATKKLDYQIARAGWIGDYTDPNTFLSMFVTGGGHNRTGWSHKGYDELLNAASRETDTQKRFALFRKAERLLLDEAPVLCLYFYTYQNLIAPQLKGHIENPLNNFDFRLFRLDK